ncbi:MAG: hypothetical protein HYW85_04685 [Deltaproteobacteria bacterium]|nr:hypothetical protein [Deltaproteobacteria bacterium]
MKKIIFITFLMFFCSTVLATDFSSLFEAALQNKLDISQEQMSKGGEFSWVFVAGFLNEGSMGRYFGDNQARLKTYVSAEEIYILKPSSSNSIETNSELLLKQLQEIYKKHHKKIVVITHSKGSPEVLKMLANEPQATSQMIAAVLTIQAAFGSQVADLFESNPFGGAGLKSLTTQESDRIFSADVLEVLAQQPVPIYFLRTSQKIKGEGNSVAFGILGLAKYLSSYGENDGLVTVERQKLQGVGTDLGIMDADHVDTVLDPPSSNTPSSFRHALMDAIFVYLMNHDF